MLVDRLFEHLDLYVEMDRIDEVVVRRGLGGVHFGEVEMVLVEGE